VGSDSRPAAFSGAVGLQQGLARVKVTFIVF